LRDGTGWQARVWRWGVVGACLAVISLIEGPKILAEVFTEFGNFYNLKGDYDRAIADYDEAIRLDPKVAAAFYNRAIAYKAKGDPDRVIADYNKAIRLDPKDADAFINRGVAYLFSESLAKAQADFKQASELAPKWAYPALWLDLAERRDNIPGHLAQAATQLDMKAWPAPVIRLFLPRTAARKIS
jgi:tetratricopeptide (TPR) repeat protein